MQIFLIQNDSENVAACCNQLNERMHITDARPDRSGTWPTEVAPLFYDTALFTALTDSTEVSLLCVLLLLRAGTNTATAATPTKYRLLLRLPLRKATHYTS